MKILIVDDSEHNRTLATKYIEDSELDLEVLHAKSGEESMEILSKMKIDIMLLDILLPGIGGIEVLKNVKEDKSYKDIKVIMYTTLLKKEMLSTCFDLGASEFIRKPLEAIEFKTRIKNIMKQRTLENDTTKYIKEIENQQNIISEANIQLIQQDKMAGVGQLAAGVAHEINNPLGFISSNFIILKEYIEKFVECYDLLMNDDPLKAYQLAVTYTVDEDFTYIVNDVDELFDETSIGVERVTKIVKSLRNFAHGEAADSMETYHVNDGLKDTLVIANNSIKFAAKIQTEFGEMDEVFGNGSQINQVFLNLLMNAVYAIKERHKGAMGEIFISTYQEGEYTVIVIKDNGSGMKASTLKDLFNPFFTTKPIGEGTGLGLSITYDIIVNKHKGKIEVDSEVGIGTEFRIFLPREE